MSNDPVLIAYSAKRNRNGRVHWTHIGQAFPHDQGAGLTVLLDVLPRDGRIILLEPDARDDRRTAMPTLKTTPGQRSPIKRRQ